MYRIGLDVGSTTAKIVVLDEANKVIYSSYRRHMANVNAALQEFLKELNATISGHPFALAITGSVGLGVAERYDIQFVQEVIAATEFTKKVHPEISTIIDIGGEDAKIVYLNNGQVSDLRMNGNCAGGTGAFIDQMALCLGVEVGDLDGLASQAQTIYPIASRCGVFSKTDIQNLIARNVSKQDIAASIFRAVAVQTASALSHGCEVKPKVLLCGGPLTFIGSLRKAIADYFKLDPASDLVIEPRANVIPAWGTALSAFTSDEQCPHGQHPSIFTIESLTDRLNGPVKESTQSPVKKNATSVVLPPIFNDEAEYLAWKGEKAESYIPVVELSELKSGEKTFLGIDSGSTTTKVVLINKEGKIVFKYYTHNGGNPIEAVRRGLEKLQVRCAEEKIDLNITAGCSTGYGEDLIKAAYSLDYGMIETMAHYVAARRMCPEVSFILDIGGQDMKAIYIDNGALTRMEINEACSSGCGSFIETFAQTLNCDITDFVMKACQSQTPSDLGTRCTVFMNSKVKQVLREGASVSDIAAGLAYSVVKNCLFKVLKLKNYEELGQHIVLQGGTMRNDSIVKAFENLTGRKVYCNNVPELMGAYGCALYAQRMTEETADAKAKPLSDLLQLASFEQRTLTCHGCENQCQITKYTFQNGGSYFSGNKCEKVFNNGSTADYTGVNMSLTKYHELFDRADQADANAPLPTALPAKAKLRTIGIPRVLNMYEEFPFWHTFFTACGVRVVLSSTSTYANYEKGVHSVMSDNICFPAKLVHSHIYELGDRGVDRIFFPRVVFERPEDSTSSDSYNCPIIIGYPEVVQCSIDSKVKVDSPVISFRSSDLVLKQLLEYMQPLGFPKKLIREAHQKAVQEYDRFAQRIRELNEATFRKSQEEGRMCIVLAGRPYHTDPLIQHKVSEMITKLGVDVLTEEIARGMNIGEKESFILKQWTFVNRILNSAQWTARQNHLVHYVETTSFGCGPDAFFVDEVRSIMNRHGKSLTLLKIDDINNVGSMKLRVRSLIESLKFGERREVEVKPFVRPRKFLKEDREIRTILTPFFTEYISPMIPSCFKYAGYNVIQLPMGDAESNDLGLKYANNEVCYPATLIVGDFIKALQSGQYDLDHTAIAVTQLGQCRATNYPPLIRKAIVDAGFEKVPVIGIAGSDTEDQPGFKLNLFKLAPLVLHATFFGDWLSVFYHATAVREVNKGEARRLRDEYLAKGNPLCEKNDYKAFLRLTREAAEAFNRIPVHEDRVYPKAGITGEIYLKFNPYSHKYVPDWLMEHGVEVVPSTVHNFFLRAFVNAEFNRRQHVKHIKAPKLVLKMAENLIFGTMRKFEKEASAFRYFVPEIDVKTSSEYASEIISLSAQFGEGWLLPAEVIAFLKQGCNNVVSMQPFGCIANHIVARGIEKKMKKLYPQLNMLSLDFDGGVSEANIANRLLLFIANMKENGK